MSGHSKWATIKRQKAATDAKRGNMFTKLGNNITIAARQGGGDTETNFKLRLAIERAKSYNMPKDNIQRAVKRGTGELAGGIIEELTYGALLPYQVAVIIKCLTDNKNRTLTDVKTAIQKNGGQFVDSNSIAWQFENKGVIRTKKTKKQENKKTDEIEMAIIDSDAEDYFKDEQEIIIYTRPEKLQNVKEYLEEKNISVVSADLEMIAKDKKELDNEELAKVVKILDALDEIDEVSNYYMNLA